MERVESNETKHLILPEVVKDAFSKGMNGQLTSITIQFRDKRINGLELVTHEPVKKKLSEILGENAYQTVEVKKHEDRISYIRKSVKIKL